MMKKIYDREMCQFLIGNVRPIDGAVRELKEETGVNSS